MSDAVVSLIERGHLDRVSVPVFRRVAAALEVRAEVSVTLPHGELERLMNAGHSAMHEAVAAYLSELPGWVHAPEVSFAIYAERGVIDVLAFHPSTGSLLVIELKTELVALENLLATIDVRLRHAAAIARDRGWQARTLSAWVIFADSATNHRRVNAHRSVLRAAFPADGRAVRGWLLHPGGAIRALSFWSIRGVTTANQTLAVRRRVRVRDQAAQTAVTPGSR